MATNDDIGLVQRAVAHSGTGVNDLARRSAPAIQAEIAHLLMRMAPAQGRNPRQDLADLMQDVYVALFEREARRLAAWDPTRGCTLDSYVRLVARSRALDVLRSRRRTPWQSDGLDTSDVDEPAESDSDNETVMFAREALQAVERRLHELLSPRDYAMFIGVFVEELSTADVAAALGMTPGAVYQWSSRFRRNVLPGLLRLVDEGPEHTTQPEKLG